MSMREPQTPKEEVAARQGTRQRMNVRVLATSLVLLTIIFAWLYFIFLAAPHSENVGSAPEQLRQESGQQPSPSDPPRQTPAPQPSPVTP
jgi:predicted metal-binding membrane protein